MLLHSNKYIYYNFTCQYNRRFALLIACYVLCDLRARSCVFHAKVDEM
jgi:hypothetical protein